MRFLSAEPEDGYVLVSSIPDLVILRVSFAYWIYPPASILLPYLFKSLSRVFTSLGLITWLLIIPLFLSFRGAWVAEGLYLFVLLSQEKFILFEGFMFAALRGFIVSC